MTWYLQLNHINRTREIVVKNDAKLRSDPSKDILDDNSFLDQGFTRPKVNITGTKKLYFGLYFHLFTFIAAFVYTFITVRKIFWRS